MGGLMAWRPQLTTIGRAGVIGTASFAVTAAADVLLTAWSRQPWPPALASVLILVPGLYLAWKAVPAAARPPRGRRVAAWDPVALGVHQVTGGGPMPPYIRRLHDDVLDALVDPDVPSSRLVVVRGGSSTGKTRAAYEAVAGGRLAGWRLEYPLNPAALTELLDAGINGRTVLWLGELRQYTEGEDAGAAALGRLARLLEAQERLIAVTTMWPGHWASYIEAARAGDGGGQDRAGTAGRLLRRLPDLTGADPARINPARGGVIDVPVAFNAREAPHASLDKPDAVAHLLGALRDAGADDAFTALASRAGTAGIPSALLDGRGYDRWPGREPTQAPSQPWNWQEPLPTDSEPGF